MRLWGAPGPEPRAIRRAFGGRRRPCRRDPRLGCFACSSVIDVAVDLTLAPPRLMVCFGVVDVRSWGWRSPTLCRSPCIFRRRHTRRHAQSLHRVARPPASDSVIVLTDRQPCRLACFGVVDARFGWPPGQEPRAIRCAFFRRRRPCCCDSALSSVTRPPMSDGAIVEADRRPGGLACFDVLDARRWGWRGPTLSRSVCVFGALSHGSPRPATG